MIPHAGSMCLLDSIETWDELSITCLTRSHLLRDNPLRCDEGLPMSAIIEYGAQAMAVHSCLLSRESGMKMTEGYLAALRDVTLSEGWLSDIEQDLIISATRTYVDAGNMIYWLTASTNITELASGRATVVGKFEKDVK